MNKLKLSFLTIFFVFNLLITVALGNATFDATVDKKVADINDQILLILTATGGSSTQPDIPYSDDFEVKFRGTSSQIVMRNNDITKSESFTYVVIPKKEGEITIAPISVSIDGKLYETSPISIKITKGQQKTNNNIDKDKLAFVTAHVNNLKPYINEQIVYTFKFYRKVESTNANVKFPDFDDFWVEDMGKQREYYETINGERYLVTEIKRGLYPTKSGQLEIKPTIFNFDIVYRDEDYFGFGGVFSQTKTEPRRFVSNAIKLNVNPIPSQNRPHDYKNIVGHDMKLEANISSTSLNAGDSATLDITVKGKANLLDLSSDFVNLPDSIKVYPDKPDVKRYIENNDLIFQKSFKFAIVPLKGGNIDINPIAVHYFNPKSKKFEKVSTKDFSLIVKGSTNIALNQNLIQPKEVNKNKGTEEQDNIFDIYYTDYAIQDMDFDLKKSIVFISMFFVPLLVYIVLLLSKSNIIKALINKNNSNSKINLKTTIKSLDQLSNLEDKQNFLDKVSEIFSNYFFSKFKLNRKKFSSEELELELQNTNISEIDKVEAINLFELFEKLKFSGKKVSDKEMDNIILKTKELLNRIEEKK